MARWVSSRAGSPRYAFCQLVYEEHMLVHTQTRAHTHSNNTHIHMQARRDSHIDTHTLAPKQSIRSHPMVCYGVLRTQAGVDRFEVQLDVDKRIVVVTDATPYCAFLCSDIAVFSIVSYALTVVCGYPVCDVKQCCTMFYRMLCGDPLYCTKFYGCARGVI